jgi:hypothetical protein
MGAKGALSDTPLSANTNPPVGGSMISASVGNIGGGEAYQYHYHYVDSGLVRSDNDDYFAPYLGYIDSNYIANLYPLRWITLSSDRKLFHWYITGDSKGRGQPFSSNDGTDDINSVNASYNSKIGTSYPINDRKSWFAASAYPNDWYASEKFNDHTAKFGRVDLSMPYAIVNKIIRVL